MTLSARLSFSIMFNAQCLKITEKVAFNIASEASYVYNLNEQKWSKIVTIAKVAKVAKVAKIVIKAKVVKRVKRVKRVKIFKQFVKGRRVKLSQKVLKKWREKISGITHVI